MKTRDKGEQISAFRCVNATVLVLIAFICIVPFWYVFVVSFSDPKLAHEGVVTLLPQGFSVGAYEIIFRQNKFVNAMKISLIRTVFGGFINLVLQTTFAYALCQRKLRGQKYFKLLVVFTMLFNGGIIPTYMVVRYTGLLDSIWALIIPNAISTWNVIILMSFFSGIPEEIAESAHIDGAGYFVIFSKLVIPLSIPAIAVISLYIAVNHWNSLMDAVLYVNRSTMKPLQSYLMDMVVNSQMEDVMSTMDGLNTSTLSVQTAAIFASTVPILIVYPLVQRYFVKGLLIGAIKG